MSIFLGLGGVILIYVFANIAYFTLLSPSEMIRSTAVAYVTLNQNCDFFFNFKFKSFVEKIFPKLSWIISIFVCLSTLGYINGALFSASRTIFGAVSFSEKIFHFYHLIILLFKRRAIIICLYFLPLSTFIF